jgi:hypothetical protein
VALAQERPRQICSNFSAADDENEHDVTPSLRCAAWPAESVVQSR